MINYYELIGRGTVPIYTKMKTIIDGNQVVNSEKEKLYNYYKCDYCGDEIIITKKRHDMTGGIAIIGWEIMKNEIVKGKMQEIARKVKEELPENWGFVVLAFEFGDSNDREMLYVSNANREDVVKAMEEFAQKTKSNYGNDTGKYGRRENK